MLNVMFVQGGAELAGAERVLLALLRHLDHRRVHPVVAFLARGPVVDLVDEAGADVVLLPESGRLRHAHRIPGVVGELAWTAQERGIDLIQATGEKMSVYGGWAARRAGVPGVFWLHDSPASRDGGAWLAQAAMAVTPRASVVSCSRWLGEAFAQRWRLPARPILNGIELDRLPAQGDGAALRAEFGWPEDTTVHTHVGRLQRWKGAEVFLRAAARVGDADPSARFLIVGGALFGREQRYAEGLPDLAASLGLEDRLRFAGHRDDALQLMASSDSIVHCSLRPDPFPTVVLEASCLGVPIVATRTRGPEEVIEHGRTGLLVAPGDADDLASNLLRLADPATRQRLGSTARREGLVRFRAQRMATEFTDHWTELVGGARPVDREVSA